MATPADIPPELRDAARARGWSDELMARALEAGMPVASLWRFSGWGLPPDQMERKIEWFRRLTFGPLRGREATGEDGEAFAELWANAPETIGEFEVATLRGPNVFAQYRLQERVNLLVIAEGTKLLASCGFATRNVLVGGRRICVRYGQGLRVHRDHRRQGLGDQVRSLPWGVGAARASAVQYDIMRTQNFAVVGWWEKYFPDFWKDVPRQEGQVPGIPVVVHQLPARPTSDPGVGVRPARAEDLDTCVALLNRTHEGTDLFRPYCRDLLWERLDQQVWGERMPWDEYVYGWEDFFVLEEGGRIRACAGLWDRGRNQRERWRHAATGEERIVSDAALMDLGFEAGAEEAMLRLCAFHAARAHARGRDWLLVPAQNHPELVALLEAAGARPDARALRWGLDRPQVTRPYTDLAYW